MGKEIQKDLFITRLKHLRRHTQLRRISAHRAKALLKEYQLIFAPERFRMVTDEDVREFIARLSAGSIDESLSYLAEKYPG